jgi:hypothetical protein
MTDQCLRFDYINLGIMAKKCYAPCGFCIFIAVAVFIGCVIGACFIIRYTRTHYLTCEVIQPIESYCYIETFNSPDGAYGVAFVDQYYELDQNRTGIIMCELSQGCPGSCPLVVEKNYTCSRYAPNLFLIGDSPAGFYVLVAFLLLFGTTVLVATIAIFTRTFFEKDKTKTESNVVEMQTVKVVENNNDSNIVSLHDSSRTAVSLQES